MDRRRSEVVVVTGASAGIGRATVREFARRGAHLGLIARGRDGLEAAKREVERAGGKAVVITADVASPSRVEQAAETIEAELGPIDVWINNAMVSVFSPIAQMSADEFRRVTDVTYLGAVYGTLAALKRMRARDRGTIVFVGSALAYRSIPLQAAYCAAKHAMLGFFEALRTELLHDESHVKVTMVQLPAHNTPQFSWVRSRLPRKPQPVPPIFQPEVAARAIYWAAHHNRRQLLLGWPTLRAVFGNDVAPGLIDRYLARNGYDAQQTDETAAHAQRNNLWSPVPGDHGAHGDFDADAKERSIEGFLSMNRGWIAAGAASLAALGTAAWLTARRR